MDAGGLEVRSSRAVVLEGNFVVCVCVCDRVQGEKPLRCECPEVVESTMLLCIASVVVFLFGDQTLDAESRSCESKMCNVSWTGLVQSSDMRDAVQTKQSWTRQVCDGTQ